MLNISTLAGSYSQGTAERCLREGIKCLFEDLGIENTRVFVNSEMPEFPASLTLEAKTPEAWIKFKQILNAASLIPGDKDVNDYTAHEDQVTISEGNLVTAEHVGAERIEIKPLADELFTRGTGYIDLTLAGLERFFCAAGKSEDVQFLLEAFAEDCANSKDLLAAIALTLKPLFGEIPIVLKNYYSADDNSFVVIGFPNFTDQKDHLKIERQPGYKIEQEIEQILAEMLGGSLPQPNKIRVTSWGSGDDIGINAINIDGSEYVAAFKLKLEEAYTDVLRNKRLLPLPTALEQYPT